METIEPIKEPDYTDKAFSSSENHEDYLINKRKQTEAVLVKSLDEKSIHHIIKKFSNPLFKAVEGLNSKVFENGKGEKFKISFIASKFNESGLSQKQIFAFYNMKLSLSEEGINDVIYEISDLQIELDGENIEVFDNEIKFFSHANLHIENGEERFRRAILTMYDYEAKVMYSGLPFNDLLTLFALFHEIGHMAFRQKLNPETVKSVNKSRIIKYDNRSTKDHVDVLKDERMASQYAIKKMRKIIKFFGIDQTVLSKVAHMLLSSYL